MENQVIDTHAHKIRAPVYIWNDQVNLSPLRKHTNK
jgi:hypothetical protein